MIALVARSQNNVIGKDGTIPWHCKADLAFFKKMTMNKSILVGRKTYALLPKLPGRNVWVLSVSWLEAEGIKTYHNIDEIPNDIIICGGASVYDQLINKCSEVYVTTINKDVEGDTFFNKNWLNHFYKYTVLEDCAEYNIIKYYK